MFVNSLSFFLNAYFVAILILTELYLMGQENMSKKTRVVYLLRWCHHIPLAMTAFLVEFVLKDLVNVLY